MYRFSIAYGSRLLHALGAGREAPAGARCSARQCLALRRKQGALLAAWKPERREQSSNGLECLKVRDCVWCKKLLNEILLQTLQPVLC